MQDKATRRPVGRHQTAAVRIGFSLSWLFFLLREWPHREQLYGPTGPWSWHLARQLLAGNHAFSVLAWSDSEIWFEFVYLAAIGSSLLFLLGWRTRTMSVLFMVGVLSLQNRNPYVGDGGDNVLHLMSLYLVLTRCGEVWSLDARRAARRDRLPGSRDVSGVVLWSASGVALGLVTLIAELSSGWAVVFWGLWVAHAAWWAVCRDAPGEPRALLARVGNLAHNAALLVIAAQVCLIYATAGWYKVQGSLWQDGTALYYPLHLDYFLPWPALAHVLAHSGLVVMLVTYGTVVAQVAFPFTLLHRGVKNVMLVLLVVEHVGIAVVLGLPFFSLAMIAADAVFLPTPFLRRLGVRVARLGQRLSVRRRVRRAGHSDHDQPPRTLVG